MRTRLEAPRLFVRQRSAPEIENLPDAAPLGVGAIADTPPPLPPEVVAAVAEPAPGWRERQRRARARWRAREEQAREVRRSAGFGSRGF